MMNCLLWLLPELRLRELSVLWPLCWVAAGHDALVLTKRTTTSDECGSPDVSPCKGQYDHYQNHHQAHFCPQVVGQAVALVVALHSHDLPQGFRPPDTVNWLEGAHDQQRSIDLNQKPKTRL